MADIRTIAPTCLHVGAIQGSIEDEVRLSEIFSRFGTVLAVTLRIRREGKKVSWALISFSNVSEADSCLAGIAELSKQHPGLVARQAPRCTASPVRRGRTALLTTVSTLVCRRTSNWRTAKHMQVRLLINLI